jgi:hypothetical protein
VKGDQTIQLLDRLGTGFLVGEDGTLMSAKHVIGVTPGENEALVACFLAEVGTPSWWFIGDVVLSTKFDIAVGRLSGVPPKAHALTLATEDPKHNEDLLCVEFSGAEVNKGEGPKVDLTPYHRKGHVVAVYESANPEPVPTVCIDLSFPALKGASGAPVIREANGQVAGMIVANVERHLLPAQIERVDSPDGSTETYRYFLPIGKAISWCHLRDVLALAQAERS